MLCAHHPGGSARLSTGIPAPEPRAFQGARALLFFEPVDLNSARPQDLVLLPSIGPARAESMVCFRQNMGFLLDVDELASPNGPLDPKILDRIRSYLSTGGRDE